jgi:thiopurine S-methyltransferase
MLALRRERSTSVEIKMQPKFWHERWKSNEIPFHEREANPLLVDHFDLLGLAPGGRVFVPLCGKTLDLHWLLSKGYRVAGAELSKLAVEQLFAELGLPVTVSPAGELALNSAPGIDVFVGDIFALTRESLGPVDAIYDRAALVALPDAMRSNYAAHLMHLAANADQLLITFEYDQSVMEGPPFSVSAEEVRRHYQGNYSVTLITTRSIPGGLKGRCPAIENVWLLKKS